MSNEINDEKWLDVLLDDIRKDKDFVDGLMRRVAQIRWELKAVFEASSTTSHSEELDVAVEGCDGELYEVFYSLSGIRAMLIEQEVGNGGGR